MTTTTINRTPFRHMKDISTTMRASEKLRWDTLGGDEAVFTSDGKRFAVIRQGIVGSWWDVFGSSAIPLRPLNMTWEAAEALVGDRKSPIALAASPPPSHLPKDGDEITVASAVAVVKEGCCQALDELLPSYETLGTLPKTRPVFTVITSLPRCRRKYVKIFLKSLGFRNVDKIPTTTEQKPYYMSLLSTENREKLISLAPGIVLRDVL